MLASLSRWRSRVQIPPGTLDCWCFVPGQKTRLGSRREAEVPKKKARHKEPGPNNASAGHWRAQVAVTHPSLTVQVQLLPGALGKVES